MKTYTDLEQSKKLAEFLPLGSEDYHYIAQGEKSYFYPYSLSNDVVGRYNGDIKYIPCWSLAALMGVLPDNCGIDKEYGNYVASYITILNECGAYTKDNPIDACYEMIMYFHKLNLL